MRCPGCGGFVQDGATFCTACGAQMAPGPRGQWGAPPPPPTAPGMPLPQPYPPPRESDSGGMLRPIVIILVVILALVIVGSAILLMGILDLVGDLPEDTVVVLGTPQVAQRQVGNVTVWDATLPVELVTPRDQEVYWDDLVIVIESREGRALLSEQIVGLDGTSPYDDASDGWLDVELWSVEGPVDGVMGPGEALKITGMDEGYQGATLSMRLGTTVIASVDLPRNFP